MNNTMSGIDCKDKSSKLYLHLKKWLERAALDYGMIDEGDRVCVGVSGGADSMAFLYLLNTPMVFLPAFSIVAVHIDLGFDTTLHDYGVIEAFLKEQGCDYVMATSDIGTLAHSEVNRKNPCFYCAKERKKRLVEIAEDNDCNKIALAHHKDDIIETLLLNIFYAREISTMHPNQSIFRGKFHIIRPFAYIRESLIKKFAAEKGLPVVADRCPTGDQSKRRYIKDLLNELERDNRNIRDNIFKAMGHVKTDYLIKPVR